MATVSVARWKAEITGGALLAGVGGFFLFWAWKLPPPDEPGVPGPGSVPIALGLVILLCGLWVIVDALRKGERQGLELGGTKQGIALAGLVLATAFFEAAGFMLATFLFLSAGFMFLGNARWWQALPAAAVVSVALWLTFTKLLGVGLPYGLIAEILFR